MKLIHYIYLSVALFIFNGNFIQATSKTLPQGVWSLDLNYNSFQFDKVGVDENGDKKFVSAKNFKVKHIPALVQVIDGFSLDQSLKEVQIADYYKLDPLDIAVAYGITDALTFAIGTSYVKKELKYTDSYRAFMSSLNGFNDALVDVPPQYAYANGFSDIALTIKYQVLTNLSAALSYTGGFLKTGISSRERKIEDYNEQLATGYDEDRLTAVLFWDVPLIDSQTLDFTLAYQFTGDGYERSLDNNYATNRGDTLSLSALTKFDLGLGLSIAPQLTYLSTGYDVRYTGGAWEKINGSDSFSFHGSVSLEYQPVIFLKTWMSYEKVFDQKLALGNYDFPGRLYIDDFVKFGLTLYYK